MVLMIRNSFLWVFSGTKEKKGRKSTDLNNNNTKSVSNEIRGSKCVVASNLFSMSTFTVSPESMKELESLGCNEFLGIEAPYQFSLVGRRIYCKVSDTDNIEVEGRMTKYNPVEGRYLVVYEDGRKSHWVKLIGRKKGGEYT